MENKKLLPSLLLLTALSLVATCGMKKGWSQAERDQLVNSCVSEAKAKAPSLDEAKLTKYCSCYGEAIEKKYPVLTEMATAKAEDLTNEAQKCLPLLTQ